MSLVYAEPPTITENIEFTLTEITDEEILKTLEEGEVIASGVIDADAIKSLEKEKAINLQSLSKDDRYIEINYVAEEPGKWKLIFGATMLLQIIQNGTTRVFEVTAHAATRVVERFAGNYGKVVDILIRRGDVYIDIEHGGYAFYDSASRCAVVLDKGLRVIKTVMDNVSIWDKFQSGTWTIPLEQVPRLFP